MKDGDDSHVGAFAAGFLPAGRERVITPRGRPGADLIA